MSTPTSSAGTEYGSVAAARGQNEMLKVATIKIKKDDMISRVRANWSTTTYLSTVINIKNSAKSAMTIMIDAGSKSMQYILSSNETIFHQMRIGGPGENRTRASAMRMRCNTTLLRARLGA